MELNGNLKIAIQKSGRLADSSLTLLRNMGLEFEVYKNKLFAQCRNLPVDILFIRDDDIPEYVQDGVADLGIVGKNVLSEGGADIEELRPLDFGYCTLSIAVPQRDSASALKDIDGKRIATSYPNTLKRYLKKQGITAEIILLKGCVEIAPALSLADAICDLVSTGSTLRTNRLKVIDTVTECQATLIGSKNTKKENKELLDKLLLRVQGVEEAKKVKYIMFNLPSKELADISSLVPGCDSPTVIPLLDEEKFAVHSVVEEQDFWDVVDRIKERGGSGILVSDIEKFIR